jgi:hypothetical protein
MLEMSFRARCCVLVPAPEWVRREGTTMATSLNLFDDDVTWRPRTWWRKVMKVIQLGWSD